ncbi:MAG: hypothetical protein QXJ81_04985 [Metallosphaera sp.]
MLSIIVTTIVILTIGINLTYLTQPIFIGMYVTQNGVVEYFRSIDPAFVIKPYLNGSQQPALISVFVNLPNKVLFLESSFVQSLKMPFSTIRSFITPWMRWKDMNTSLLVIVTYFNGNQSYSSAEEIEYNPQWVFSNANIQIVGLVNVIR